MHARSGRACNSAVLSSTPFRRFGSAVVRRAIDRLQRNPFALRLALDCPDGSLKLDAHDTRGRIALCKLPKLGPRLTRAVANDACRMGLPCAGLSCQSASRAASVL